MNRVYQVIIKRRTIRRFKQNPLRLSTLKQLVNAARLAPSAANLQPCEYIIVNDKKVVPELFKTLRWAGYIAPKGTPPPGKEPVAYIVVLVNRKKGEKWGVSDASAAIENIILTAADWGIGCCWIAALDKPAIKKLLKIPAHCAVEYVVALGYPDERPVAEPLKTSHKYWQDKTGTLHVPKRSLAKIAHYNRY